ncbi:MAG: carboxymuconolactone decarboxylase family protein, partial [Myxococcota bacterium]
VSMRRSHFSCVQEAPMGDPERRKRGVDMMKKVYAGDVVVPPEGASAFADVMLEQLFAEVWTREELPIRDRRLLIMGIIAEKGEPTTFGFQARAALKRGELSPAQLRETLLMSAQYAGYPRAAALIGVVEKTIAEVEKERTGG